MYKKSIAWKKALSIMLSATMIASSFAVPEAWNVRAAMNLEELELAVKMPQVVSGDEIEESTHVMANVASGSAVSLKYDFGGKGTANEFTPITTQMYNEELGYGFTQSVSLKNDKGTNMGGTLTPINEELLEACKDYTYTEDAAGLEFKVDVPAGIYDVEVYAGLGGDHQPVITVNGKNLGVAASVKPSTETDLLKTTRIELKEAGSIVVGAKDAGSKKRNMLNALVIRSAESTETEIPIPQNVASVETDKTVVLNWDAVEGAIHYNIFRANTEDGTYLQVGTAEGTSFTDPVVTDKAYYYYVVAVGQKATEGDTAGHMVNVVSNPSDVIRSEIVSEGNVGTRIYESYSDRGLVAAKGEEGIFTSWRLYEADSDDITFTLKRNGTIVYQGSKTNFLDKAGKAGDVYTLQASEGISSDSEETASAWGQDYQEFTLIKPDDQRMPDGTTAVYVSNDMSVGDLDGDGQLELIVKWYPSNAQDNSTDGYTGTTILDAYDINISTGKAELMWRIDLGLNIRSGAHYTQFQVWDFDGDGKAELMCKTADGSTVFDKDLHIIDHVGACDVTDLPTDKTDSEYDYRQHEGRLGRIVLGAEYISVFDGETGRIIDTANYEPARGIYHEDTGIYDTYDWGLKNGAAAEKNDGYANRADRFLSATAYLDDGTPCGVFCRGYYGRTSMSAWKLVDGKLALQWFFYADNDEEGAGQGNHSLAVNDVDGDGYDEIIFGGMVMNNDGSVLSNTGWGHGDAHHVSDWNGDGKLEVYKVNEEQGHWGGGMFDPETGEVLDGTFCSTAADTGRGVAADIDPRYEGAEYWHSVDSHTHAVSGEKIYSNTKPSMNFSIFWDGDLMMELFDSNNSTELIGQIQKWDYETESMIVLEQLDGTGLNNGTKANAGLVADLYGDWREEVIVRNSSEAEKIRIYTTTMETEYSIPTFMENLAYREAVAWQNVGYNQPANVDYLLTRGMKTAEITVGRRTTDSVELTWTEASDGIYGHAVQGYEIYRAPVEDGKTGEFVLAGTVEGTSFVDTGLLSNSEYAYKVAMIVDGKSSYRSFAVSTKTTVQAAGLKEIQPIQIVQDSDDYEKVFPATATLLSQTGMEQVVDVTWNLNDFSTESTGTYTVSGNIYGYDGKVEIQVTVLPNQIVSYEAADVIYTLQGEEPELPETITVTMKNAKKAVLPVNWEKTYDKDTIGAYTIEGSCVTVYGETLQLGLTVEVKEDFIIEVEARDCIEIAYDATADEVVQQLPATVTAVYKKAGKKEAAIVWDKVDTTTLGVTTLDGTVADYPSTVTANIKVEYAPVWKFDFGVTSGKVAEGWTGIVGVQKGSDTAEKLGLVYSDEKGYGFLDGTYVVDGRYQPGVLGNDLDWYPAEVYQDMGLVGGQTFEANVENGTYVVEIMSGSTDKNTASGKVEGKSFSVGNDAQHYAVERVEGVEVKDGKLTVNFNSGTMRMNMIVIRKVVESRTEAPNKNEQVSNILADIPDAEERPFTAKEVLAVEKAANLVASMTDKQKQEMSQNDLQKLDGAFKKAKQLITKTELNASEIKDNSVKLVENSVSATGMAVAASKHVTAGDLVSLCVTQQTPQYGGEKVVMQIGMELLVNGTAVDLSAPILLEIELPQKLRNAGTVTVRHFDNDGNLKETFSNVKISNKKIYLTATSFSAFTFEPGMQDTSNSDSDDDDTSYRSAVHAAAQWVKDSNGWWYRNADGTYPADAWKQVGGKWYFFDKNGYMETGWVFWNNKWYFLGTDGAMIENSWVLSNDKWYYLNAGNGDMDLGWVLWKNMWYYLNSPNGDMAVNTVTPDGYRVGADGVWVVE